MSQALRMTYVSPHYSDLLTEEKFLNALEHYCRIRSGTSNIYGVNEAQNYLIRFLEPLGFIPELITNLDERNSGELLVARRMIDAKLPTVLFISHADTLDGNELDQNRYSLLLTDKKIVGQGVLDDKASQFVALRGLAHFLSEANTHINLIFVSSPNEELGSYGFQEVFNQLSLEADIVLGFEPALEGKDLVVARRGNRWYDLEVTGREAHAGRGHKTGVNAAHELSILISKLHKLTNYNKDITVNIGEIKTSSQTYNVVCGRAFAKVDTRFSTLKDREELHKKILKVFSRPHLRAFSDKQPCEVQWKIVDDCPPLHSDKPSRKWAELYANTVGEIESRKIELRTSGGGADVCYFNRKGLIVIDGLGACGEAMHRSDEYVQIESLWSRSLALKEFLLKFQATF